MAASDLAAQQRYLNDEARLILGTRELNSIVEAMSLQDTVKALGKQEIARCLRLAKARPSLVPAILKAKLSDKLKNGPENPFDGAGNETDHVDPPQTLPMPPGETPEMLPPWLQSLPTDVSMSEKIPENPNRDCPPGFTPKTVFPIRTAPWPQVPASADASAVLGPHLAKQTKRPHPWLFTPEAAEARKILPLTHNPLLIYQHGSRAAVECLRTILDKATWVSCAMCYWVTGYVTRIIESGEKPQDSTEADKFKSAISELLAAIGRRPKVDDEKMNEDRVHVTAELQNSLDLAEAIESMHDPVFGAGSQ